MATCWVMVEVEDPLLRQMILERARDEILLHLAQRIARRREVEILGQLLRDGRAALRDLLALPIPLNRLLHRLHIDAAVFVEVLVFGGEECVDDPLRDRLDRQVEPPLLGVFGKQRTVRRMHPRHHRRFVVLQLRIVRQVLGEMPDQAGGSTDPDQEQDRPRREQKP